MPGIKREHSFSNMILPPHAPRPACGYARPNMGMLHGRPVAGGGGSLPSRADAPLVTWHRLRPFQMCSMRLLIAELLRAWKAPGAERPIFLPGDLCRSPPPQLATKRTWHLCYSRDNEGAAELVARLERASSRPVGRSRAGGADCARTCRGVVVVRKRLTNPQKN